MKKIFICHPFENDKQNLIMTKEYCLLALQKGYNPISPAIYYSQFLDDGKSKEREQGHTCGIDLLEFCDELWICGNRITKGMSVEINKASDINSFQSDIIIKHVGDFSNAL